MGISLIIPSLLPYSTDFSALTTVSFNAFSNLTSLFLVAYTNLCVHTLYLGTSAKTDFQDAYRDSVLAGLRFALESVISTHVVQAQVVNGHTWRNTELGLYN